jgi:hypothetical protein
MARSPPGRARIVMPWVQRIFALATSSSPGSGRRASSPRGRTVRRDKTPVTMTPASRIASARRFTGEVSPRSRSARVISIARPWPADDVHQASTIAYTPGDPRDTPRH